MCLSRLDHQRHCGFCLAPGSLPPEASYHIGKTLMQLFGEVHVVRNGGFLPTGSKNLKPPANNRGGRYLGSRSFSPKQVSEILQSQATS